MDIWDANKLLLFIAFAVPGFLTLKTYELLFAGTPRDSSQRLVDAVAYSSINYALLLWPIYAVEAHGYRNSHPNAYIAFYVLVLLIAPVSWACLWGRIRTTKWIRSIVPHPEGKPWDYVFKQGKCYWVVVTLKDSRKIGGRYDERSFASSAPHPEQLYLEEAWFCNDKGGLDRPKPGSAGVLIMSSEIMTVDLFPLERGCADGRREEQADAGANGKGLSADPATG